MRCIPECIGYPSRVSSLDIDRSVSFHSLTVIRHRTWRLRWFWIASYQWPLRTNHSDVSDEVPVSSLRMHRLSMDIYVISDWRALVRQKRLRNIQHSCTHDGMKLSKERVHLRSLSVYVCTIVIIVVGHSPPTSIYTIQNDSKIGSKTSSVWLLRIK